jgi:hypothetical protein
MADGDEGPPPQERSTITTTIEVDKDIFLKFKALCVLNQITISGEIEKLIRRRVDELISESPTVSRE